MKVRNAQLTPAIQMERIAGDPRLVKDVTAFYTDWLVKGNVPKALQSLSPRVAGCVSALSGSDPMKTLSEGMASAVKAVGKPKKLEDAVSSVETEHEALKIVTHPNEKAFGLYAGPEKMGNSCSATSRTRLAPGRRTGSITALR